MTPILPYEIRQTKGVFYYLEGHHNNFSESMNIEKSRVSDIPPGLCQGGATMTSILWYMHGAAKPVYH
jgi:hypothetical protein